MTDSIMSQSQYLREPVAEIKGRTDIIWGKLVVPTGVRSRITIKLISLFPTTRNTCLDARQLTP
jgi:hypothetical protein